MTHEILFRFWGPESRDEACIRSALVSVGIEPVSLENHTGSVGIIAFSEIDAGLITWIRDLHSRGLTWILVFAVDKSALQNRGIWRLLEAGAADVTEWSDLAPNQILAKVQRFSLIEEAVESALTREPAAGETAAWRELVRRVVEAGHFSNAPVLLTGDSGTGKEHLARLVHAVLQRPDGERERPELVTVDCTTIVPELSGSELFGHEKGAFTGAHNARDGAFALANGGTLFLDEVGELSLPLQAQLLRAIQEKTYKRVGGNLWLKSSFRLVCATNRDLHALVESGHFRLDLYHRIASWVFRTLRIGERRGDILPLARHFLRTIFPEQQPELDSAVCDYLLNRSYPGNIRELRQLVERIAHRHAGPGPITVGDIPEEDRPGENGIPLCWPDERFQRSIADAIAMGASLKEISTATTAAAIRIAVQSEQGNLQRAARRLGVTDRALQLRRAAGMIPE